jgi:uncharacterized membrane protein
MSATVRARLSPRQSIVAAVLVVVGALLRFAALGQQSFWHDEIDSVLMARGRETGSFAEAALNTHGPLYLVCLRGWMRLGGSGEAFTRMLSALFGVLGLLLFLRIARRFVPPGTALVALALLVVSPFHLGYSQEARGYSLLFALGLLALETFLRDMEQRTPASFAIMLLASLATCLSNLSGFFMIAVAGFLALTLGRRTGYPLRRYALYVALVALLLEPWIVAGAQSTGKFSVGAPPAHSDVILAKGESPPGLASIPYSFYDFTFGRSLGPNVDDLKLRRMRALLPHLAYLLPALVLVVGLLLRGWRTSSRESRAVLVPWLVLPIVAMAAFSIVNFKAANSRYAFLSFAPFLLMLAGGVASLGAPARRAVLLVLLALFACADFEYFTNPYYWKPDVRGAGRLIAHEARHGDAVVVYALAEPLRFYVPDSIAFAMPSGEAFASDSGAAGWLFANAPANRRLWIVQCNAWWMDRTDRFRRVASGLRHEEARWPFVKLPVFRYRAESR